MKTKLVLTSLICLGFLLSVSAETHTITNSGLTFTPNEITIAPGDIINWSIGNNHNVVEVSKETWDANGNSSNGGFTLDFGGGELSFNTPGTFYYVCSPHASSGMKGVVIVEETVTEISDVLEEKYPVLHIYPNPVRNMVSLNFTLEDFTELSIEIYDITGRNVKSLFAGSLSAGKYSRDFNLESLRSGRYIVYFKANEEIKIQQISVIE